MKLQIVRRTVQGAVILLTVALAFLSLYAHYRAARVIDDEQLMAGLRGEVVTRAMHPWIDMLQDPRALLDGNKGSVWSMRILGWSITDPLAAVEALASSKFIHLPLLLSVVLPVLLTLLLGKVFCSWICPGYVLFEIAGKLRKVLRIAEIPPGNVRFSHANKYVFLVVGLAVSAMVAAPFFALIYPPAVVSRTIHAWIFGTELGGMLVLLGVVVAFEVFVSPRWWCRTMCPGGALYGLLGAGRPLRVELVKGSCTGCRKCIPVCEAGINPIVESSGLECDNCGVCIRHCKPAALRFVFTTPVKRWRRRAADRGAGGRPHVAAGLVLAGALLAPGALGAHHVLGLPHYSYKENYPQRPTLEYPARSGPWDILFTSYPGHPVPGEPANLAFYIKNRETGEVYGDAVTVRVLRTSTFGDNRVVLPPTGRAPFDNEHKLQCLFPEAAEYIVELSLEVEGRREVVPFLVIAGKPTATASIVLALALGLGILLVAARAAQKKRQRARSADPDPAEVSP